MLGRCWANNIISHPNRIHHEPPLLSYPPLSLADKGIRVFWCDLGSQDSGSSREMCDAFCAHGTAPGKQQQNAIIAKPQIGERTHSANDEKPRRISRTHTQHFLHWRQCRKLTTIKTPNNSSKVLRHRTCDTLRELLRHRIYFLYLISMHKNDHHIILLGLSLGQNAFIFF